MDIWAVNIEWDTKDEGDVTNLPKEVQIPWEECVQGEDNISDYLTNEFEFCHNGFSLANKDNSYLYIVESDNEVPVLIESLFNLEELGIPTRLIEEQFCLEPLENAALSRITVEEYLDCVNEMNFVEIMAEDDFNGEKTGDTLER